MAGALRYRDPERAEHNVRLDVDAARAVLRTAPRPTLVLSDVTFTPEIEITTASALYRFFAGPAAPAWGRLLRAHLDAWFARHHPGTMQHDALTLSVALGLPFVELGRERIAMDERGRLSRDDDGYELVVSLAADYPAFLTWLKGHLLEDRHRTVRGCTTPSPRA